MLLTPSILLALALAISVAAPAAAAPTAVSGLYKGKSKAGLAKLEVSSSMRATVRYRLRGGCDRARGRIRGRPIRQAKFRGRKRSGSPSGATVITVRGRFVGDGDVASLVFSQVVRAKAAGGGTDVCRARRRIKVRAAGAGAGSGPAGVDPVRDAGHYAGTSAAGLPVSFDVAFDPSGRGEVRNFDVDVATECEWWGDEGDPLIAGQVVRIRSLDGEVDPNGAFTVYATPDDDTEYDVFGELQSATAKLDVFVDGPFDAFGNPDPASALLCDNWGETYTAKRVGG